MDTLFSYLLIIKRVVIIDDGSVYGTTYLHKKNHLEIFVSSNLR